MMPLKPDFDRQQEFDITQLFNMTSTNQPFPDHINSNAYNSFTPCLDQNTHTHFGVKRPNSHLPQSHSKRLCSTHTDKTDSESEDSQDSATNIPHSTDHFPNTTTFPQNNNPSNDFQNYMLVNNTEYRSMSNYFQHMTGYYSQSHPEQNNYSNYNSNLLTVLPQGYPTAFNRIPSLNQECCPLIDNLIPQNNAFEKSSDSGVLSDSSSTSSPSDLNKNEMKNEMNSYMPRHSLNNSMLSPYEIFCTVPGRTSLLSSTTKYRVTIAEVQRRISPPECLNASLLGGILRKAKSKDGGKNLRESLRKINLTLPAGRRKAATVTAFTSLVEEEAVHMARDFNTVCDREFPAKALGIEIVGKELHNIGDGERFRLILENTRQGISMLVKLLNSDRSPLGCNNPPIILESHIQKPLSHFAMVTHGFGSLAICASLNAAHTVFSDALKQLEIQCPSMQHSFPNNSHTTNYYPPQMGGNAMPSNFGNLQSRPE
uniref:TF_AP-2 domain-containing protein n=1 Tax=Rhabditophanes sp. KR3021 TaxID=114890 RepID=A0AC35TR90_9BILA